MRVSVVFRNTPVLVPVGEGRMKISDLIEMAITRYKKTDSRLAEFTITVRSLRLLEGGSFVDLDDEVADVLDDKEVVLADFDLIGDSMSTSSQESGPLLPTGASYSGRVKHAHSSQPDAASNLLSVPSSSNPSLADHDDSISSEVSPWTPSASLVAENDIPESDVLWRQGHREAPSTNSLTRANRTSSFVSSQSERFAPSEPSAREMAVDGPLQSNRSSFTESLSEARLRVPSLSDARSRNSYAGPGIYERERLYDDHHYPPRRFRNKPYHPMDGPSPQDYMRYRYRSNRLEGYNQRFQERPGHGMFPRHGSASNLMQQQRVPAEDGTGGYQGRYEEPVDYFLSQPLYFHEHRATNEPSGYALSQPAHTFRSVRPSVVHAADLDPNSEAPHLRHLSQDDHSSRSDTPTYRSSPVPEGMRLDAATYHGNRVLRFSDNEDDDNYDQMREEHIGKQQAMSRYVPFQRNKRFSIQRDGLVFARWAEYCENSGIPESDEDKDDESVRHVGGYSPNSSREELSYHGNSYRGGRTASPPVDQDGSGRGQANGRQTSNHIQSATESESEDDLGNIHIIELHKGSHELGIRIKKCSADNKDIGIFVDAIETEGFAAVSHKLQINDRILACNGCDFTKLSNQKAENMFKEMMDEPLLRMAISRGNQYPSGEGSDVSDHHHGDGDSTVDGSDPGYSFTNTREIGVIHDIKIMKGSHGLGFGVTTRDVHVNTKMTNIQPIYIKNIAKDGPAFRDGRLKLGDRLLKVNGVSVEQMTQAQVVQLMRSLPPGAVTLQVSRQETRPSNNEDDAVSVLEVPASNHSNEATLGNIGAGGSGRTVMTFDIIMHQSDTASLGVTVHGRTRQNSPSHSSKSADIGIYIKSIVPGGLAAMDGRVQPGDQVLCVSGHNLLDRSNSEAMAVLKSALAQIKPGTNSIQLVISRKTTSVPLRSPAATTAIVSDVEIGIDVGNAAMATPNSQSSQSSAGVVRIDSTENLLVQRRRNESEPLSKYSLERTGSQDQLGRQATRSKTTVGKSPVKRSASESRYDNHHLQSEHMSPSRNSSSSGSGLVSPTGVTLTLSGSHDSNSLLAGRQNNRPGDRHGNYAADMLSSSTPVHHEQVSSRSHGDYPSHSLPRPSTQRKRAGSPSPRLESSGSTDELGGAYFRRDAPERISIKKSKQAPQRDFSQFNFRNSEPKVEGDDSSSIDMMRTGSAESILASRSPLLYKVPRGPHLGLAKSSSLESLQTIQTILAAQRLSEASDDLGMRSREARSSFRKAVDKSYDKPEDPLDEVTDHGLLDPSLMSFTKNPKNKVKRRGFLKNLFRKGKHKRFSSLAMDDHHGDINESPSSQIDFDPTPPARVELRPHHHDNASTSSNSSSKMYQRYSMSVLDNMEFEDDDITATIADV